MTFLLPRILSMSKSRSAAQLEQYGVLQLSCLKESYLVEPKVFANVVWQSNLPNPRGNLARGEPVVEGFPTILSNVNFVLVRLAYQDQLDLPLPDDLESLSIGGRRHDVVRVGKAALKAVVRDGIHAVFTPVQKLRPEIGKGQYVSWPVTPFFGVIKISGDGS